MEKSKEDEKREGKKQKNDHFCLLILFSRSSTNPVPIYYTIPICMLSSNDIAALSGSTPEMLMDYEPGIPGFTEEGEFDENIWTRWPGDVVYSLPKQCGYTIVNAFAD